MPPRPYHARVSELPRESRFGGTYQRTGVISDHALWSFVWLDGFEWPEGMHHQHAHDQLVFVISGRLRMTIEDETYLLEAGDLLYVPANLPHTGSLVDGEPCFLVEGFAPIRTDYLYIAEHQLDDGAPARQPDGSRVDETGSRFPFENPLQEAG